MQISPDWRQRFKSPEEIEKELIGFKFKGPGCYLTKTNTVIVIPLPPDNPATPETIWNMKQPKGTCWEVNVYNCPSYETFLGFINTFCGLIPTRQDER